jgi:hypothetical protein
MPLCARLLTRAARLGQLEHLRWLRAHGCAWEPCTCFEEGPCSSAAEGGHLSVLQWARADGCPWDWQTCANELGVGTWPCSNNGLAPMAARGKLLVQPFVGTWQCCSGLVRMAALGMRAHAGRQLKVDTWPSCSGLVPMAALGMRARAVAQLRVGTWPWCSGLVRMAALGMRARAVWQPMVGTWPCCSGLVRMAARGMRARAVGRPIVGTWPWCSGLVRMAAHGMCGRAVGQLRLATWRWWTGLAPMDALSRSEGDGWLGPGLCARRRGPRSLSRPVPCGHGLMQWQRHQSPRVRWASQVSGRTSSSWSASTPVGRRGGPPGAPTVVSQRWGAAVAGGRRAGLATAAPCREPPGGVAAACAPLLRARTPAGPRFRSGQALER